MPPKIRTDSSCLCELVEILDFLNAVRAPIAAPTARTGANREQAGANRERSGKRSFGAWYRAKTGQSAPPTVAADACRTHRPSG